MILHGRRDRIAVALVDAVVEGKIQTPGQMADFIAHLELLPARLQSWCLEEICRVAGDEFITTIKQRMRIPGMVPA
jgi:hypothetical protein